MYNVWLTRRLLPSAYYSRMYGYTQCNTIKVHTMYSTIPPMNNMLNSLPIHSDNLFRVQIHPCCCPSPLVRVFPSFYQQIDGIVVCLVSFFISLLSFYFFIFQQMSYGIHIAFASAYNQIKCSSASLLPATILNSFEL